MKKRELLFKAYYITHSLLSDFQENGGICSMKAEELLFYDVSDFLGNHITELELVVAMKFRHGLTKRNLTKALKGYEKYRERN